MLPKEQAGVDLNALDPEQLASFQQQLEEEIQGLAQSSVALQKAAGEFGKSGRAVEALGQQKEGECAPCMHPFPVDLTLAPISGLAPNQPLMSRPPVSLRLLCESTPSARVQATRCCCR